MKFWASYLWKGWIWTSILVGWMNYARKTSFNLFWRSIVYIVTTDSWVFWGFGFIRIRLNDSFFSFFFWLSKLPQFNKFPWKLQSLPKVQMLRSKFNGTTSCYSWEIEQIPYVPDNAMRALRVQQTIQTAACLEVTWEKVSLMPGYRGQGDSGLSRPHWIICSAKCSSPTGFNKIVFLGKLW